VDVRGLELLLARLGDDFVAEAVAFVRVAPPERGLFEAMAPVRVGALARTAASLFSQRGLPERENLARPFPNSAADAWLVRFAEVAAPALVPLVPLEDARPPIDSAKSIMTPDRAARAALAWIAARGRADAIPSSHATVAAPFAALAELDQPWLSFLAARGLEAQALGLLDASSTSPDVLARAGTLFAAHALTGNARAAAAAWLEARRTLVEPILHQASERGSEDASVALAVLAGDTTAGDPKLDQVPRAIPALPEFFDAATLPAPRLQDGTPLSADAVVALGEMLRFTSLARPYPGITQVRSACDPASLDDFALALLNRWGDAGEPPMDLWALESTGKIGGDGCAREIARRIRTWSKTSEPPRQTSDDDDRRAVLLSSEGDRGWAYARIGCHVLAAHGSDLALTLLDDLARTGAASWLRKEARRFLDLASEERKLRSADVADDIVPDFGLDQAGSATIDLGSRTFKVTFDETLAPQVIDTEGVTSRSFPRARKDDDAEKAAAARLRFQGLAKDAKTLARQQIAQLDAAMCSRRAWAGPAFRARFIMHPLLRHLARRLVWGYEDLSKTFRLAEDLSCAGENDAMLALDDAARIILVHPVLLGVDLRTQWSDCFRKHGLVQPLSQLGRETFTATDEERGQHQLVPSDARPFGEGTKTDRGRLSQLNRRGWTARVENGWIEEYSRVLPSGAHARIGIAPGMAMPPDNAKPEDLEEHVLTTVSSTYALDRLAPIDFSELVRDVAFLAGAVA
jgi:hypothetical protein